MAGDEQRESLELDYGQTTELIRTLTDVRFKLLAFVPTISAAAVAIVSRKPTAPELLAIGLIGLVATSGIVVYEVRNTQITDYALERAKELELRLGMVSVLRAGATGGLYGERPAGELRLFAAGTARHDRALALVYGAAIAGWVYLVAWGALRAANVTGAQKWGGAIAAIAGVLVLVELIRIGGRPREDGAPPPP